MLDKTKTFRKKAPRILGGQVVGSHDDAAKRAGVRVVAGISGSVGIRGPRVSFDQGRGLKSRTDSLRVSSVITEHSGLPGEADTARGRIFNGGILVGEGEKMGRDFIEKFSSFRLKMVSTGFDQGGSRNVSMVLLSL